jgi:hypothetical protein
MTDDTRGILIRQFDLAWQLARYHLNGLTTAECLWRPGAAGPHVWPTGDGRWRADWPEHEDYGLGPPSIAWVTWHMGFWWSMVLDHAFGDATLQPQDVAWPGDAESVRAWLDGLAARWRAALERLSPDDVVSSERTRWPFTGRPFGDVVAWANVELTKNAAEIGYARFLHAVRDA